MCLARWLLLLLPCCRCERSNGGIYIYRYRYTHISSVAFSLLAQHTNKISCQLSLDDELSLAVKELVALVVVVVVLLVLEVVDVDVLVIVMVY